MPPKFVLSQVLLFTCLLPFCQTTARGAEDNAESAERKPAVMVEIAEGKLVLPAPGEWTRVKPRSRILELEFSVLPEEEEQQAARFTVMASGGTIQQNIDRWIGQFRNHKSPKEGEVGQVKRLEVDGMAATTVDISGDYLDSPRGPFGPKVERADYRMLAAILETKSSGNYFFKLVGPEELISKHAKAFENMLKGIKQK